MDARGGNHRKLYQDPFPDDGGPEMPEGYSKAFKKHWDFLIRHIPKNMLRKIDSNMLKSLAMTYMQMEVMAKYLCENPMDIKVSRTHDKLLMTANQLSAKFGMTPVDRRRTGIEPEPEESEFAIALKERNARRLAQ